MKKYSKYLIILTCIIAVLVSICFIPINATKLIPVIEKQVEKDLGVNIHVERLILRVGPFIKLKAPIMHVTYEDGQKFAQLDGVKLYVNWLTLLKDKPVIEKVYANNLNLRLNSDDKYLPILLEKLQANEFGVTPNIQLKNYEISYLNKLTSDKYNLKGQNFLLGKISNHKNMKITTSGDFSINSKKYINYDIALTPKLEFRKIDFNGDITKFVNQIKDLDFHSDIIADLTLFKKEHNYVQASGFVNIDNISVLDSTKKNPKSFIYLTFLGDKIGVLSNVYTSLNKKVYVEGKINNSKNLVLDLKVKTDEISLADLYKKLKIFTDLSKFKNLTSVNGTLNANFTVKGDLKNIKSNGYMKITNADIKANGFMIEKINSNIDFSNNKINISDATGYVNNAPILLKGSIDKDLDLELSMNRVELKYLCPDSVGVKSGIATVIAKISGNIDKLIHKEQISIENLNWVSDSYDLTIDSIKLDTNKNNTAYINGVNCVTPHTELIKIPSLKFIMDNNNIKIPETNLFIPNSKLVFKGNINNFNSEGLSFVSYIDGFVNSKDIKCLKSFSTRYPLKAVFSGNKLSQSLNTQVLLEKAEVFDEPCLINAIAKLEKKVLKIEELSLLSFTGKFNDDLKQNVKGGKKLVISGAIDSNKTPIMKNIRVFVPQQLHVNLYDTIAQIKGDVFVNGSFQKPDMVGQLVIQNLFNNATQLSLSNSTLDFNKNTVNFNAPNLKLADSATGVNASISTDISKALVIKNINLKSKYLNTDTLLMYKDNLLLNTYPVEINNGKFYSERILANVYGEPLYLSGFNSDFEMKDNLLVLKNITSELFNGKLGGKLAYNMKDEHFDSDIMARGVSADPIFDVISKRKDNISGTMDFDLKLTGELTSKQSLNGDIKFVVTNGRMSTLGKLEHLLYAQNVVADNMLRTSFSVVAKAITLKDTGLFKYLRGDVALENGIANIKMLQSQGPLMALFIKGQYNPMNDYANLIVLGRLSDEIISGLGAFGDFSFNKLMIMLTGEETKQAVLPEDFDKIPQLPIKNTKEFRSIINGIIDKPSSVTSFNWISYSQKSLKQKDVPISETKIPSFIENLPY